MITVTTTSPGEARVATDLFRKAPAYLDWRVYHMGSLVVSSADLRARTDLAPERLHPAHERMRELLAERGTDGYATSKLHHLLCSEGRVVARETTQRWLSADEKKGYVSRKTGQVGQALWVWAEVAADGDGSPSS